MHLQALEAIFAKDMTISITDDDLVCRIAVDAEDAHVVGTEPIILQVKCGYSFFPSHTCA